MSDLLQILLNPLVIAGLLGVNIVGLLVYRVLSDARFVNFFGERFAYAMITLLIVTRVVLPLILVVSIGLLIGPMWITAISTTAIAIVIVAKHW